MVDLAHEIWIQPDNMPRCNLAGQGGDGARSILPPGSRLTTVFHAGSRFEAMTKYDAPLNREEFTSAQPSAHDPYPQEWLDPAQPLNFYPPTRCQVSFVSRPIPDQIERLTAVQFDTLCG